MPKKCKFQCYQVCLRTVYLFSKRKFDVFHFVQSNKVEIYCKKFDFTSGAFEELASVVTNVFAKTRCNSISFSPMEFYNLSYLKFASAVFDIIKFLK